MVRSLGALERGAVTPQRQAEGGVTYARKITKDEARVDWSKSAAEIERGVRGFQPWPNAYTHNKSQRLIVFKAEPATIENNDAGAGKILVAHGDELLVKCGEQTALRLIEVQPEAKRRMSVRDYLNGTHHKAGDSFE